MSEFCKSAPSKLAVCLTCLPGHSSQLGSDHPWPSQGDGEGSEGGGEFSWLSGSADLNVWIWELVVLIDYNHAHKHLYALNM